MWLYAHCNGTYEITEVDSLKWFGKNREKLFLGLSATGSSSFFSASVARKYQTQDGGLQNKLSYLGSHPGVYLEQVNSHNN